MFDMESAIRHCEEVAEEQDKLCKRYDDASGYSRSHNEAIRTTNAKRCEECASEHRQLAEWLKELKAYREAREEIIRKRDSSQWSELVVHGFSHAIYTIDNHLKEVNADEESE